MILLIIIHWQNFGDKLAKLDLDYKLILDILFYSISTCGYNETEKSWFSSIYSNVLDSKKQNKIYTKLEKFKFNGLTRKLLRVLLNEFDHKEIFNYCLEIYYKLRSLLTIEQCKNKELNLLKTITDKMNTALL